MSPILGTIAGFSAQGYGALKASAASVFTSFLSTFGFAAGTGTKLARKATFDSNGNIIVAGQGLSAVTSGNTIGQIAKYSSDATLTYQTKFEGPIASTLNNGFYAVTTDTSGNIYAAGQFIPSSTNQVVLVIKYNSAGTVLWKKQLSDSMPAGTKNSWARGIKVDVSGNVYVCGSNTIASGQVNPFLIKLDSNGNLLWQRGFSGGSTGTRSDYFNEIAIDSAGNIYAAGRTTTAAASSVATIAKYDSTGALVFSRQASISGGFSGIKLDSSGNIYTSGSNSVTIGAYSGVAATTTKFDPSGNLLWQRGLYSSTGQNAIRVEGGIDLDSDGNIYVAQTVQITEGGVLTRRPQIIKYNSSGVLQWQKYILTNSDSSNGAYSIAVYKNRYVLSGQYFSEWLGLQFPIDGSKNGTYTLNSILLAYADSSYSEGLVSGTTFASGGTNTTPTFTIANATTTESVSTATSYIVTTPDIAPTIQVSGGTLTSDATYYYRAFTSNATLSVTGGGLIADVLVVGGGGGGGTNDGNSLNPGGGGGAGGLSYLSSQIIEGSKVITIGGGGAMGIPSGSGTSTTYGTTTVTGGGRGGSWTNLGTYYAPTSGASGGGAVGAGTSSVGTFTPAGASGSPGGSGGSGYAFYDGSTGGSAGGGGGGCNGPGGNGSLVGLNFTGGNGGLGATYFGTLYAAGGKGSQDFVSSPYFIAQPTYGGGGANTGAGGNARVGGGASGVVIVRYTRSQVGG